MEDIKKNEKEHPIIDKTEDLEDEVSSKDVDSSEEEVVKEPKAKAKESTDEIREIKIVAIKRRKDWAPLHYDAGDVEVSDGEWVVFPTDHGIEVGRILGRAVPLLFPANIEVPKIERLASTQEIEQYYRNLEKEKNAWKVCEEFIKELGLSMKLVVVESFFDGSKVIFYYVAEQRVDFRELVKRLVRALRTRIEMRQIGVRHEAKMLGGIGCCGRELCCSTFLKSFDPISIKMAKAQNLPLNPSKISGICGRLLCCLTYEYDTYLDLKQGLPSLGKSCNTPEGEGKVINQNIILGTVTVALADGARREFSLKEIEEYQSSKTEEEQDIENNNLEEKKEDNLEDIFPNEDLLERLSRHEDFSDNISYIELGYEDSDTYSSMEDISDEEDSGRESYDVDVKVEENEIERKVNTLREEQEKEADFNSIADVDESISIAEDTHKENNLRKPQTTKRKKRVKTRYRNNQDRRAGAYMSSRHERHVDRRSKKSKKTRPNKKERTKRR